LENGKKTLRAYSDPFDLSKWTADDWVNTSDDLVDLVNALDDSPHYEIVSKEMAKSLRKAEPIERRALQFVEWKRNGKKG
jgi:hypothetical protein